MNNYKGSIDLISGLRPKNNGAFPLMEAKDIQTREDGTRLDAELALIWAKIQEIIESGGIELPETIIAGDIDSMDVLVFENKLVSEVEA